MELSSQPRVRRYFLASSYGAYAAGLPNAIAAANLLRASGALAEPVNPAGRAGEFTLGFETNGRFEQSSCLLRGRVRLQRVAVVSVMPGIGRRVTGMSRVRAALSPQYASGAPKGRKKNGRLV
eukprot:13243-Prorocentrum_minimum.AAC.2